jgi:hypothetical protein
MNEICFSGTFLERKKYYIWVPFSWEKRILRVEVCGSSGNSKGTELL